MEIINLDKKPEVITIKKNRDQGSCISFYKDFKITNIDIKNSTYDLTIENTFEQRYDTKDAYAKPHIITKLGLETLFIDDENGTFAHLPKS